MGTVVRQFDFKTFDAEGEETLEVLTGAHRLNRWQYEIATRHLSGELIEIGSGIGNISAQCLEAGLSLTLSDIRLQYCERLQERFAGQPTLRGVLELDLVAPDFEQRYAAHLGRYDGLFSLNVIEHIEDDVLALRNAKLLLKPGGRMLILVPAFEQLYNRLDLALYHYRRYTRSSLSAALAASGMQIEHSHYFNAAGMAGWFLSGRLQGNRTIPGWQIHVYNALVPVFRLIDVFTQPWLGLSVVALARRPD
jgi:2-polyprenyl-3-methyl-5-hydroxy-6-metoxy-1,4-benzoquinol methylase